MAAANAARRALGIGFGFLGLAFVVVGVQRNQALSRYLASGRFETLDGRLVWGISIALLVLGSATILLVTES